MINCDGIMGWGISSVNEHEGMKIKHVLCMIDVVVMELCGYDCCLSCDWMWVREWLGRNTRANGIRLAYVHVVDLRRPRYRGAWSLTRP